jgi:putative Holliday junction resolvase
VTGRVLAIDFGTRRLGLAISDASRTLARPLEVIVVGMPRRLDGTPGDQTARVTAFIGALARRTALTIVTEDERLSSREAESRLAVNERDWRRRKARLDAAAAAVVLQDYLDRRPSS